MAIALQNVSFTRVSEIYDKSREISDDLKKKIRDFIAHYVKKNDIFCDIGSGTGRFGSILSDLPIFYISFDISFEILMNGKDKYFQNSYNMTCIQGNSIHLPFADHSTEIVFVNNFLHLIDTKNFGTELLRVLKPNGFFIAGFLDTGLDDPRAYYESLVRELWNDSYGLQLQIEQVPFIRRFNLIKQANFSSFLNVSMRERLEFMRKKAYSSMWVIPDNIHRQIMEQVESKFANEKFSKMKQTFLVYVFQK